MSPVDPNHAYNKLINRLKGGHAAVGPMHCPVLFEVLSPSQAESAPRGSVVLTSVQATHARDPQRGARLEAGEGMRCARSYET